MITVTEEHSQTEQPLTAHTDKRSKSLHDCTVGWGCSFYSQCFVVCCVDIQNAEIYPIKVNHPMRSQLKETTAEPAENAANFRIRVT